MSSITADTISVERQSAAIVEIITSSEASVRDRSLQDALGGLDGRSLLRLCRELDAFRLRTENLYHKVRASLFLHAILRYHLQDINGLPPGGELPAGPMNLFLGRRYEKAIEALWPASEKPHGTVLSALAECYRHLAFDTLAGQVRRSVRQCRGNRWMFRVGHFLDHPLRIHPLLLKRPGNSGLYPLLVEQTAVRLDLSHSGWSDIFFLGMDYPEGARVINISADLGVYGRDTHVTPPISVHLRVLDEPIVRLCSLDLGVTKDIGNLEDLFNFGNDYLSLLKAAVIASGAIPPSLEGTGIALARVLEKLVGPGLGLEMVTSVNDIPKGSRLAVSTNLLGGMISVLMRATGQTCKLTGGLREQERRLVASRAILGEWLGGSGGGWQDSGGVWPAIKRIEGVEAAETDPEWGVSRGALLPRHQVMDDTELHTELESRLKASLVLLHGGMAQNVGPILEMVTEKYLLRSQPEWDARAESARIYARIRRALREGDIRALAEAAMDHWRGPLKTIIPWVTNRFTECIIADAADRFGDDFWGFLMLGGMSGGGMAMFCAPAAKPAFQDAMLEIMTRRRRELSASLPFAIDPQVFLFDINQRGSWAELHTGEDALMPARYYPLQIPGLVEEARAGGRPLRQVEFHTYVSRAGGETSAEMLRGLAGQLFQAGRDATQSDRERWNADSERLKKENGFDITLHEQLRSDLLRNRIGLARNRLPVATLVEDVRDGDLLPLEPARELTRLGEKALISGEVGVMSLAAGVGSRWTQGAGVIKALNPFVEMAGSHRSFLEIHLAKTRATALRHGIAPPHIVATGFLTHGPIAEFLGSRKDEPVYLSPGMSISQRLVPTVRDLVFLWEEMPEERLDEQKQKVRDMQRRALIEWARQKGEAADYVDNHPLQRFNPPGHFFEVPNLLKNGTLATVLKHHPRLKTLLLHNIDTLGLSLDPLCLGAHLQSGSALTFEVVPRRMQDKGGGLARVNDRVRLLEGLAQPRDEDELRLRYYNSMSTWIDLEQLLKTFSVDRDTILAAFPDSGSDKAQAGAHDAPAALEARRAIQRGIRDVARKLPTYATIKQAKYRWGFGQEDVYPVLQFEKLWSDMSALPGLDCAYLAVPRLRGQQLKDVSELDSWSRDGSRDYVESLCAF